MLVNIVPLLAGCLGFGSSVLCAGVLEPNLIKFIGLIKIIVIIIILVI